MGYRQCSYGNLRSESSARPGWRVECQGTVQCADPVGEAAQARPAARIRAADTVVAHFDHAWPLIRRTATVAALALAYLATLVSASAITK